MKFWSEILGGGERLKIEILGDLDYVLEFLEI